MIPRGRPMRDLAENSHRPVYRGGKAGLPPNFLLQALIRPPHLHRAARFGLGLVRRLRTASATRRRTFCGPGTSRTARGNPCIGEAERTSAIPRARTNCGGATSGSLCFHNGDTPYQTTHVLLRHPGKCAFRRATPGADKHGRVVSRPRRRPSASHGHPSSAGSAGSAPERCRPYPPRSVRRESGAFVNPPDSRAVARMLSELAR